MLSKYGNKKKSLVNIKKFNKTFLPSIPADPATFPTSLLSEKKERDEDVVGESLFSSMPLDLHKEAFVCCVTLI